MKNLLSFIFVILVLTTLSVAHSDTPQENIYQDVELICTPTAAAGIAYSEHKNKWEGVIFTANKKFLVLKSDIDGFTYKVKDRN